MDDVSGLERRVLGVDDRRSADALVGATVAAVGLGELAEITFRSGRIAPVYGVRTREGEGAVVKVHRSLDPAGTPALHRRLTACQEAQTTLADAGFPCPRPLGGATIVGEVVVTAETQESAGERGSGREPADRDAMVRGLAAQVAALERRSWPELVADPPAWADVTRGAWPPPHDPIFDFSRPAAGHAWVDELAGRSAAVARSCPGEPVVAHGDWTPVNLRFAGGRVVASFDWDSLMQAPEPVVVGVSAAGHLEGGRPSVPSPAEVVAYVETYERARGRGFDGDARLTVAAAVTYCLAYNARCQLALPGLGITPEEDWLGPLEQWHDEYAAALHP